MDFIFLFNNLLTVKMLRAYNHIRRSYIWCKITSMFGISFFKM